MYVSCITECLERSLFMKSWFESHDDLRDQDGEFSMLSVCGGVPVCDSFEKCL